MSQIEQYHEQIKKLLRDLDNLVHRSALYGSNRKKWKDQCSKLIQNITDYIRTCQELISELPGSSVKHFVSVTKGFKKQLEQLKDDMQRKAREENSNMINTARSDQSENNAILTVIKRGDETQDRTNEVITSMFQTVGQGISLADQVNIALNKQIEQLDRIHDKVRDTDSTLKRAQKSINYFVKALQCDKCMLGLILLNLLALIALIVLLVKKNGG